MKSLYSVACAILISIQAFGQVPVISDFAPTSGRVGTSVIITGSNFSTTPSTNIVYFGSVQASVTAASSNQLTVTVPPGTIYKPISVTVNGLTTYSTQIFNTTFPEGGFIVPGSFGPPVSYTSLAAYRIAIGDLDNDGKSDIAVLGVEGISVFRNIGTSSLVVFAPPVNLPLPSNNSDIALGDLDGDGKLDLVVATEASHKVTILRNNCVPGSITTDSFEPMVSFAVARWPFDVSIQDLDGDGKPDLAVVTELSTISVLRNTSTVGSITASSFAPAVNFTVGTESLRLATGDLDGDGKPEIVATSSNTNAISILRNTSSPGSITSGSFATKVDFVTTSNPFPVAIADLDSDNKPDIVVVGLNTNTVSVLKNTSILGSITASSFAAKVDFSTGSAPSLIDVADMDGDGKPDLIFGSSNSLFICRNISASGTISPGSFEPQVDIGSSLTMAFGGGVSAGDLNNDGKPDLAIMSSQLTILPNILGYAVISDFTPMSGEEGITVTISGHNFDPIPSNNIVKFNGTTAVVTSSTSTSIVTTVPVGATNGLITVEVDGLESQSASPFILPPVITSFTPLSGPSGSTVVISGFNFEPVPANNTVAFNGADAVVLGSTSTSLTVAVPSGATSGLVTVFVNGFLATSTSAFEIKEPQSITFNAIAGSKTLGDLPFTLDAAASSGLPVEFSTASSNVSISGNQVTLLSPGSVTIAANQSGNALFSPASPVHQTFCILPMKPRISVESSDNGMPTLVSTSSTGNQWYFNGVAIAGATSSSLNVSETGYYNVKVTVDHCVSQMSDDTEVTVTGTENSDNQTIVLYPIPAHRTISLVLNGFGNGIPVDILLYNTLWQLVMSNTTDGGLHTVDLDISRVPKGIYIMQVGEGDTKQQLKFVKED